LILRQPYTITQLDAKSSNITFEKGNKNSHQTAEIDVPRGNAREGETEELDFVKTEKLERVLSEMVQDHAVGRDLFLVCITSLTVLYFSSSSHSPSQFVIARP
jgi:hypothetical protein